MAEALSRAVVDAGAGLGNGLPFPDHHPYGAADETTLAAETTRRGVELVTTEKDHVRLSTPLRRPRRGAASDARVYG